MPDRRHSRSNVARIDCPTGAPALPRTTTVSIGITLMLMSFASGCMDILGYRELGQVFTSAMTGNVALLGLDLGQGNILATSRNMAAFAGFLTGLVLGAAWLRTWQDTPGWSRAITSLLVMEEGLLVAFAAVWHLRAGPSSDELLYGLITLSAVAMGMQSAAAHRIGVPGITTTYFTGTLTSIVVGAIGRRSSSKAALQPSRRIPWSALAFLAYVIGAALTGFLLFDPKPVPALAPTLALAALPAVVIAIVLVIALVGKITAALRAKQVRQGLASPELAAAVDAWITRHPDPKPSYPQAIRQLIALGLEHNSESK